MKTNEQKPSIYDLDKPFRDVWCAYVDALYAEEEIHLLVEAFDREQAKVAATKVVSAIFPNLEESDVENSIYGLKDAKSILENGVSENLHYRFFETAWKGNDQGFSVMNWAENPVFAVKQPSALFEAWKAAVDHFEQNKTAD